MYRMSHRGVRPIPTPSPGAMHPHEVAVHLDGITASGEIKRALVFVELHKHFTLDVVNVGALYYL